MTSTPHTLTHEDHRRTLEDNRYVYAVLSRRSGGLSVGINLNPDKVCNFHCTYCQVDRTTSAQKGVDLPLLTLELTHVLERIVDRTIFLQPPFSALSETARDLRDIAFSGDGEPTSSPVFPEAVEQVGEIKRSLGLTETPVVLITNASLFHRPTVKQALERLSLLKGEIWAKLDAGTPEAYRLINRSSVPFEQILENLVQVSRARPIVLQSMFLRQEGFGYDREALEAYLRSVQGVLMRGGQVKLIQVYSVARRPTEQSVRGLSRARLEEIADEIRQRLGVPVSVFVGSDAWLEAPDQG